MESTILASIIGAISVIIAAIVTALLPHYLKNKTATSNPKKSAQTQEHLIQDKIIKIKTWAGRKEFEYSGSVKGGTKLYIGKNKHCIMVSKEKYQDLLNHFAGRVVEVGSTMSSNSKPETLDEWLKSHVTGTMISTYVASVLKHELYATNSGGKIRFNN